MSMEPIKVRLYRTEDDNYNELWKEVGSRGGRFFCRHTFRGAGLWYHVCDPLGYCELDYPVDDEQVFVVCDSDGNPLFEDSNGRGSPFPTLEAVCKAEWAKLPWASQLPDANGFSDWCLSYMTPYALEADPDRTQFCPAENWVHCWHENIHTEVKHTFDYLGTKYAIWEVVCRHLYAPIEWAEYFSGPLDLDLEYPGWIMHHGTEYNHTEVGPMFSRRQAISLVADALTEAYPGQGHFSTVENNGWGAYERRYSKREAAELLLGGNLSRAAVAQVINDVRANTMKVRFYLSSEAIRADYPDYTPAPLRLWGWD